MDRRLGTLHYPSHTLAELIHKIQVAWNEVPQAGINRFILSMPRCAEK